mmetsp:Transcript_130614/g.418798  ORF Transcript_130614/g.418798 Transcript_130614/m.418798 type:complete len:228 (-) Transcript_130614:238-921(-)
MSRHLGPTFQGCHREEGQHRSAQRAKIQLRLLVRGALSHELRADQAACEALDQQDAREARECPQGVACAPDQVQVRQKPKQAYDQHQPGYPNGPRHRRHFDVPLRAETNDEGGSFENVCHEQGHVEKTPDAAEKSRTSGAESQDQLAEEQQQERDVGDQVDDDGGVDDVPGRVRVRVVQARAQKGDVKKGRAAEEHQGLLGVDPISCGPPSPAQRQTEPRLLLWIIL